MRILSELDKAYKHRTLLLAVHRIADYPATMMSRDKALERVFHPMIPFKDGVEIARLEIGNMNFSVADADLTVDGGLFIHVACHRSWISGDGSAINLLGRLANAVSGIADQFAGDF